MEGYLTKLGYKSGKWQRRWFTLVGCELVYAATPGLFARSRGR